MKICWDNLEDLKYDNKTKKFYKNYICNGNKSGRSTYKYIDSCDICQEPFLTMICNKGIYCSKECSNIKDIYHKNNIPKYSTYAYKLSWCEKVRRNKEDFNLLEVKCVYCGKWYIPSVKSVNNRLNFLNGKRKCESLFYCSEVCKGSCPIYYKQKYIRGNEPDNKREVQPELRQMVLERDGYQCIKCGSTEDLHCHHIEGINHNPIMSADMDICITVCKKCHKEIHQQEECSYNDMKCKGEVK